MHVAVADFDRGSVNIEGRVPRAANSWIHVRSDDGSAGLELSPFELTEIGHLLLNELARIGLLEALLLARPDCDRYFKGEVPL